jgi:hypothetical protein
MVEIKPVNKPDTIKSKNKPIVKIMKPKPQYYTVRLEVTAPVLLVYTILAETPEKAIEMVERNVVAGFATAPKPNLGKHKKNEIKVYMRGTTTIVGQKRY